MPAVYVGLVIAFLPIVSGLCYSPVLHGFTPDVFLHGLSSEVYCPRQLMFDHFLCMCVESAVGKVRIPTDDRTSLELSLIAETPLQLAPNTQYRLTDVGLPDMHMPGRTRSWLSAKTSPLAYTPFLGSHPVVPPINPYGGGYNLPASSSILKAAAKAKLMQAAMPTKQQEVLEKVQWQQELQRQTVVAAAAAAASANTPAVGGITMDDFMKEALRRILHGY